MSLFVKQHHLLKILTERYLEWEQTKKGIVAVPLNVLFEKMKCNKQSIQIITARLFSDEEIGFYNLSGIEGLHIKPKGITSYAEKKYLKERELKYFDKTKKHNSNFSTCSIVGNYYPDFCQIKLQPVATR